MANSAERARLLFQKAEQDAFALRKLAPEPEAADELVGFHAQQAVEKLLKATLAHAGTSYRKTHDLIELIDLLRETGVAVPENFDEGRHLTPFAAEFRYDPLPEELEAPLDRQWAVRYVERVQLWVRHRLDQ